MRILFITNYYPPSNYGGGYMQLCEEVADGLAAKGHEIAILASTHCDGPEIPRPYPVHRLLTIDPDWHNGKLAAWQFFVRRKRREQQAIAHLQELVKQFNPQVIFIWHASGLPRVILQFAEAQRNSVIVYYLADYLPELPDEYLAYWKKTPVHPLAKLVKKPLRRLALAQLWHEGKPLRLRYENVICVSEYVRQRLLLQYLIPKDAVVIHNGVDVEHFSGVADAGSSGLLSCLIAGRIVPEKGLHTAIDAFAELKNGPKMRRFRLVILGDGPANYVQQLQHKVTESGLQDTVRFLPSIPRDEMPAMLRLHQVLILPSEYAEPIARSMQEAMAMGLLVVGTTTGGSGELLVHERTGLVFEAGSARSLAQQMQRIVINPDLIVSLVEAGQKRVRQAFRIDQMIAKIEAHLQNLVVGNSREQNGHGGKRR